MHTKQSKAKWTFIGEALDTAKEELGKKASDIGTNVSEGISSNLKTPEIPSATQTVAQPAAVTAMGSTSVPTAGVNLDVPGLQAQTTAAQGIVANSVVIC